MSLAKNLHIIKVAALLLLCTAADKSSAQMCRNPFPCAECAVYDNNGNDLKTFIVNNKKELLYRGSKVSEYSGNNWGYIHINTGRVPSVAYKGERRGDLDYYQTITATYVLCKTADGAQATWWARQCNSPKGPLEQIKVKDNSTLDLENVRYEKLTHELQTKNFTIVEYYNDTDYNQRDYDNLLKNYILVQGGAIKDVTDYKAIIEYYNDFLNKFSYMSDPLLENKSFVTLFTVNNTKYMGCFNVVNAKLAGHLEVLDIQYQADKDTIVNRAFSKLTGKVIHIYGDRAFGMEKAMSGYARKHNVKIKPRSTSLSKKFNEDK